VETSLLSPNLTGQRDQKVKKYEGRGKGIRHSGGDTNKTGKSPVGGGDGVFSLTDSSSS